MAANRSESEPNKLGIASNIHYTPDSDASEEVTTEDGIYRYWREAVPVPMFVGNVFVRRYKCLCLKEYKCIAEYELHWRKAYAEEREQDYMRTQETTTNNNGSGGSKATMPDLEAIDKILNEELYHAMNAGYLQINGHRRLRNKLEALISDRVIAELEKLQAKHIAECGARFQASERDDCVYDGLIIDRIKALRGRDE